MMNSKGISPIIASILLIMIVISSASVVYNIAGSLTILPPVDTSVYLEDLKIVNVGAEGNYIYIYAINRGGVDVIVDAVYVESPSGEVLAYHPVYYNVSAGGTVKITIPKGNLDISNPLKFKLASKKGTLTTSLEIVKGVATPYLPSLFTFYPTRANIIKGSHIEGTLPNSVMYIDNSYYTVRSEAHTNNPAYHPTGYIVNQGSYVNGSVLLLQSEDQQSMYFLSSPSGYVERIYNASQFIILNGSLISGSIEDTYAWDVSRMTFFSQTSVEYPISNMNFTHNASGWYARVTEIAPSISPSTVTRKASGLVSANQRAVARTDDPNKSIHVVYSNGTYLGYSISVNDGRYFVDHWFVSTGAGYEPGRYPSITSDVNNNIHIAYENTPSPTAIYYLTFYYNKSYGGNPRTSTLHQNVTSTTTWATHFIAMGESLSQVELYIRNASASAANLTVEIRWLLADGTPDLSPVGLIASAVLTSVPSTFSWVSVNINAELKKGYHYALLLRTNGTFSWAYVNSSYVGSLGGWAYTTAWSISPNVHFCFRIPGWFGWTAGARVTLHSVTEATLNRPAIALYPYLTSLDQSNNSTTTYYNVYGNYFAAQSFRPSSNVLSGVMLFLFTIGGTAPTDHLYIEIRRSNGSLPDMSSTGIITSGRIESSVITTVRWYDCIFNTPAYLNVSEVYWIVVYSRYSTASNSWMFYYSTANPYANGSALISNDGGSTWTPQPTWDFAFRTYSSKDERPAVAWYYQAPSGTNRLRIQFIRCIPNADPSIRSNWYNYNRASTSPNDLYMETITLEARVSMSLQPNTNAIYIIFIRGDSLRYTRIYGWNPEPGNWYGHSNFIIGSGASMAELSSAPDPYNNRVIFTFVNSTNNYSYVYYFTSNNTLVNIPSPTNMRYPTLTFIAERIFIVYQISTGLAYRYYDGTWSSEIPLYSGNYTLPNLVYRPLASSVDLIFLNGTNHILYGAIFPTGFIKIDGPFYDSRNGNPGGSGGGSFYILIDDRHFDYSFHRLNVTFFTNFSSPSSWGEALASFAWRFELGPSGLYNNGNYSNVVLYSVRLILADALGNDISVLYNDNNAGSGWMGTTVGYFFRNGIPVTLSPSTNYSLKIVFDIGCLNPMDMFLITARIDDVGIAFISYPTVLNVEFSGISDTEDWSSIWIRMVSNVSHVPANCTIRVYNFELGRYPNYGEMGYFNFTYTNTSELLREFQITSGANSFRNSTGGWRLSILILSNNPTLNFGLNMLNFIPRINIHSVAVEFYGTSDILSWPSLLWRSTQAFSLPSVNVTIQLYNYTAGAYQTSGFGYVSYSSGSPFSYQSFSQNTSHRAEDFRDSSGNWKVRVTATRMGNQFYMMNDYILFSPTAIVKYELDVYFTFTNISVGLIINMTYNVTCIFTRSVNATFYLWDYSTSSWALIRSYIATPNIPETIAVTLIDSRYISSGESRIRVYAFEQQQFDFRADQIKLDIHAI